MEFAHGCGVAHLFAPLVDVVGGKTAKALAVMQIHTVEDLLRHYPRRYAERGELTDLTSLKIDDHVTVVADIEKVVNRTMRNRRGSILEVTVTDGRGRLALTFFNQAWREKQLRAGRRGLFSGKVGEFRGARQLAHPEYVLLPEGNDIDAEAAAAFANALIPVYPATAALPSWRISACIDLVLPFADEVADVLPESVKRSQQLMDVADAIRNIHRPQARADVAAARDRLKWDEAFVLQAELARRRAQLRSMTAVARNAIRDGVLEQFDQRMPFTLTAGQQKVGAEIAHDLSQSVPMHRLLQGEVGSGKTLVALRAILNVIDAGGQAALLAPTEVLAVQHYRSIVDSLFGLPVNVVLLTGSLGATARKSALLDLVSGNAQIVVGTHALLEDKVEFFDLGLVVVDEQHRFGVEQRAALARKGRNGARPHVLVMTATPIPRTVAMTVFGDLDVSTLTELPAGRAPITTHVVDMAGKPAHVERMWQRIEEEVAQGRTAYVVCPRIGGDTADEDALADEGTTPPLAAVDIAEELAQGPLSNLRIGVMHGRLPADQKDSVMRRFANKDLDVLVSTTVIEVGVDVPHASVMVIMDADRFGVSQLHQLRGRVGRGGLPGLCLLATRAQAGTPARERLDAVAATTDGFELARFDVESRREGDVLGAHQSGRRSSLRLLEVLKDEDLIRQAREVATAFIDSDPDISSLPALRHAIEVLSGDDRSDFLDKG